MKSSPYVNSKRKGCFFLALLSNTVNFKQLFKDQLAVAEGDS